MLEISRGTLWLIVIGIALGAFLPRFIFLPLLGRIEVPKIVMRALRFVPPAALAAILLPALLVQKGQIDIGAAEQQLGAALIAAVVAWRTRNVLYTVATGMLVLWLLQWFER